MNWTFYLSFIGLAVGTGMGLYAMVNPRWAARLVRLRDDPARPGGAAEFRATYGGLFCFGHLAAALMLAGALTAEGGGEAQIAAACLITASLWWGTAIGRLVSILADRAAGAFNWGSLAFELVLGAMIAAPALALDLA